LYQKDPTIKHHWRANIARPAQDIDLASRQHNALSGFKLEPIDSSSLSTAAGALVGDR
jgi:hypothetical protein